jgi:hypothetical protein
MAVVIDDKLLERKKGNADTKTIPFINHVHMPSALHRPCHLRQEVEPVSLLSSPLCSSTFICPRARGHKDSMIELGSVQATTPSYPHWIPALQLYIYIFIACFYLLPTV